MSAAQHPSVIGTLTAGIQDISAILPIIGTDQCENHVGSALKGGYLYAAAAPLSIFGCLGIVKAAVAILISSVSIPATPTFLRRRYRNLPQSRWLGARILGNAGFKLQGSVAPLIGMDNLNKKRFKAEERLLEILEEKHIDDPENISIEWDSYQWNVMLVVFTLLGASVSLAPYIALLVGPTFWRPTSHLPWLFPCLRTAGSCLATVCCQFLIQSRIIHLMKTRVLFMTIHRRLGGIVFKDKKVELYSWLQQELSWDTALPSEQCIWRLEQFLSSKGSLTRHRNPGHISIELEPFTDRSSILSVPSWIWSPSATSLEFPQSFFNKNKVFDYSSFQRLRHKCFPNPTLDHNVVLIAWIALFLSIPATVAGYAGCFTLVSASRGNGPLIWLALEVTLSTIRILIWAWNPKFDEITGIDIKLKLTDQQPMVTTEDYNPQIYDLDREERKPIALVPERRFLEWITPYTGPLEQFRIRNFENLAVYFTLTTNYAKSYGRKSWSLLLTVLDVNKRIAFTLTHVGGVFTFFPATALYNLISGEMEANLDTVTHVNDLHQVKDPTNFEAMQEYYKYVLSALNQPSTPDRTATLGCRWDLSSPTSSIPMHEPKGVDPAQVQPLLGVHSLLYLDRGYEHHLKSRLVDLWGRWVLSCMDTIYDEAKLDCYEALADRTSEKAKGELTYLDVIVAWEWTRRELTCLELSTKLEEVLQAQMELCINVVGKEEGSLKLREWMLCEFDIGRLKRMEKERRDAKERMEAAMKHAGDHAEREGRISKPAGDWDYDWKIGLKFIEDRWSGSITGGHAALHDAQSQLNELRIRRVDVKFMQRLADWHPQQENERIMMEATVTKINSIQWDPTTHGQRKKLDIAYEYPEPDRQATRRFVSLPSSTSKGKACAAMVYNAYDCDEATVCGVIQKSSTRSVINVNPAIVPSIHENDHLLFLSCQGGGPEPAFVQRNRNRFGEQSRNSSTFYFSPQALFYTANACSSHSGTIAHIFIFLAIPSRVRLCLLHYSYDSASVSIQEGGKELARISSSDMSTVTDFRLQALELAELGPGRHELEVVSIPDYDKDSIYVLRDILVDFPENTSPHSRRYC